MDITLYYGILVGIVAFLGITFMFVAGIEPLTHGNWADIYVTNIVPLGIIICIIAAIAGVCIYY